MYVMCKIALHYCSKFQKNLTGFGRVMGRKPLRSSLQWQFQLVGKHLIIYNLATTNAILMKLTTIIYLHETFHLAKKLGRNLQGIRGHKQKTSKNEQENQFFGPILPKMHHAIKRWHYKRKLNIPSSKIAQKQCHHATDMPFQSFILDKSYKLIF